MGHDRGQPSDDWARRPSAMFAALLIGAASLAGMGITLSRMLANDPAPTHAYGVEPVDTDARERNGFAERDTPRSPAMRRIDINTASTAELDLLPGIGPALARRIVDDREANGPYSSVDALTRVRGIGPRTVEKIRPFVVVATPGEPADEPAQAYTSEN